jgi:hypothetical protein
MSRVPQGHAAVAPLLLLLSLLLLVLLLSISPLNRTWDQSPLPGAPSLLTHSRAWLPPPAPAATPDSLPVVHCSTLLGAPTSNSQLHGKVGG